MLIIFLPTSAIVMSCQWVDRCIGRQPATWEVDTQADTPSGQTYMLQPTRYRVDNGQTGASWQSRQVYRQTGSGTKCAKFTWSGWISGSDSLLAKGSCLEPHFSRVVQEAFDGDTPDQPDPSSCTRMLIQCDTLFYLLVTEMLCQLIANIDSLFYWNVYESSSEQNQLSVMQAALV